MNRFAFFIVWTISCSRSKDNTENQEIGIESVVLSPEEAYVDSDLLVTTTISGDPTQLSNLAFEWHVVDVNGNDNIVLWNQEPNLNNNTQNDYFSKGDQVYVSVSLTQDIGGQNAVLSNEISILNTAPSAPSISVFASNQFPIEGVDDLICAIEIVSSDVDGDDVTYSYEWSLLENSNILQSVERVAELTNEVLGVETTVGNWVCSVESFDGEEASESTSAIIFVDRPAQDEFVYGSIAGQGGWSTLTNGFEQPDSFAPESLVPNDQDNRGDSIVGLNLPETGAVFNGVQAWWFKRGYDSPGAGTPYTPNLTVNALDSDGDGTPDQGFLYQLSFKVADEMGDVSTMAVITGDPLGIDRASNYISIHNDLGNLNIQSYYEDFTVLIDNLDQTIWHTLEAEMIRNGDLDYWTYRLDGEVLILDEVGYFSEYRVVNGYPYTESSRVKFQPKHGNWDSSYQGFYFDDLVVHTINSHNGSVIESYRTGFE